MLSFLYWLFRDALFFFGMVSGRGSFPKPLSRQEEQAAIAAMQAGDEDGRRYAETSAHELGKAQDILDGLSRFEALKGAQKGFQTLRRNGVRRFQDGGMALHAQLRLAEHEQQRACLGPGIQRFQGSRPFCQESRQEHGFL